MSSLRDCCCAGHLTNLSELLRRNGKASSSPVSPSYSADLNNDTSSLERKSSIERSLDVGAATASLVLGMYLDGQRDDNEVIMLSELQVGGQGNRTGWDRVGSGTCPAAAASTQPANQGLDGLCAMPML